MPRLRCGHKLSTMALLRKGGALALAVVLLAGPALACVAPVAAMAADHCCQPRPMANCGTMQLPSAKSCCAAPATQEPNSLVVRSTTASHLAIIAHVAQPVAHDIGSQAARLPGSGESPPESPPGSISILRI